MSKIVEKMTDLVGGTPLVRLNRYSEKVNVKTPLVAKVEYFNPSGSVKDRAALAMVEEAEKAGLIHPGDTIIEPTSGNTGVGLAFVAAVKGYHLILTMPESMSVERRKLVAAYGARVELTPAAEGMKGTLVRADELKASIPGSIILQQFENPANPNKHYQTTAEEIWADTDGKVDVLVAGVGTGGTLCGTGRRLKELNPAVQVVAVEPASSPLLSEGKAGPHKIQGIGANFVPGNYDASVVNKVLTVTNEDAIATARLLATSEGLFVGISSGAAVAAARELALLPEYQGKTIVVVLPDSGDRYFSTPLFE